MRDLSIISGQYSKHSDDESGIVLRLLNDAFQTTPDDLNKVTVYVKNTDTNVLDHVNVDSINDDGDLVLNTDNLDQLAPGSYAVEVHVVSDNGKLSIYPTQVDPDITIISDIQGDDLDSVAVSYDYFTEQLKKIDDAIKSIQIKAGQDTQPFDLDKYVPKVNPENNHWVVNGVDTNVQATGKDGHTPKIEIKDGVWYVDGKTLGVEVVPEIKIGSVKTVADLDFASANLVKNDDGSYSLNLVIPKGQTTSEVTKIINQGGSTDGGSNIFIDPNPVTSNSVDKATVTALHGGDPTTDDWVLDAQSGKLYPITGYDSSHGEILVNFNAGLKIINNLKGDPGQNGKDGQDGKSAYQIAVDHGYTGTEVDWLNSLHGANGKDAQTPIIKMGTINTVDATADASATLVPGVDNSYTLNLALPRGAAGANGKDGTNGKDGSVPKISVGKVIALSAGTDPTVDLQSTDDGYLLNFGIPVGKDGTNGTDGKDGQPGKDGHTPTITIDPNTYQLVVDGVATGPSLRGAAGQNGHDGQPGKDGINGINGKDGQAATIKIGTVTSGDTASVTNAGTDTAAVLNITLPKGATGATGATGESAYQTWLDAGNIGTEYQFLASLKGSKGDAGPQGQHGFSTWADKYARGGNGKGTYWSDLYGTAPGNGPQVGDLIIQPDGSYYQVTAVSNTNYGQNGGGTFDIGNKLGSLQGPQGIPGIQGPKGDKGDTGPQGPKGNDAVINVVTQAQYDALTDKTGVYFIGG